MSFVLFRECKAASRGSGFSTYLEGRRESYTLEMPPGARTWQLGGNVGDYQHAWLCNIIMIGGKGCTIPLLLEQTIQTLGNSVATDANVDDGTVGGPGPCKKRGILNMLYIARVRLQTVCEDDGVDGFNQHAIRRDLETALGDLKLGQIAFREVTKKQWGDQVAQGEHGIQQAIGAVEAVLEDTINGDLDWLTESVLVQEAEDLLDEEALLDYVHPANVAALEEGANEAPVQPEGSPQEMVELVRSARAVMHFVPQGGEQFRQVVAAVTVWQQQASGSSIAVDTQTTEEGTEGDPEPADRWVPPLNAEQWTGRIPSSGTFPTEASPDGDPYEPTDDDLLHALEEFERQEQTAALGEATDELREVSQREEEQLNEGDSVLEHRRRRVHAAFSE